jgi:hypothetical protein
MMSSDPVDPAEYEKADPLVLDLILQESDKRVGAQVQLMLAADTRASGILAGSIVLAAAGLGYAMTKLSDPTPLGWASFAFGACEVIAAFSALFALWPQAVDPQGWAPDRFATDLEKSKARVQAEIAHYLQRRIVRNREMATRLSRRVKVAMLAASMGPLVGLAAGLVAYKQYVGAAAVAGALAVFLIVAIASFNPKPPSKA